MTAIDPLLAPYARLIAAAEAGLLPAPAPADPDDPDPWLPEDLNTDVLAAAIARQPRALWTYGRIAGVEMHPYDPAAGEAFLRRLFPDGTPGLIELRAKLADGKTQRMWLHPEDIGEEAEWVHRHNRKGCPVWVGIAPRRSSKSGDADNCLPCRWLWADLDFKGFDGGEREARQRLGSYSPSPTFVVESGGGLHCYWRVEPLQSSNWLTILKAKLQHIAAQLGADMVAAEAARVLRLPGTYNAKYEPPALVRMVDYALL